MLLLTKLAEWRRDRAERDCPQHHWHPDRLGWHCCWSAHRRTAGNEPPPEHTTRLCTLDTSPVDTLQSWLRDIQPGQHRRPLLPPLGRRRLRQPTA